MTAVLLQPATDELNGWCQSPVESPRHRACPDTPWGGLIGASSLPPVIERRCSCWCHRPDGQLPLGAS